MKINTQKILEWTLTSVGLLAVVFLIGFENKKEEAKRCTGIKVEIDNASDQLFVSPKQVVDEITHRGLKPLEGKLLSQIDLCGIEKEIKNIPQIQDCEVYGDLKGVIHINAKPYQPIARVVKPNGRDFYMDHNGTFFPLSTYHSARVVLISGEYFSRKRKELNDDDLLSLVHTVIEDPFWKAQITQLDVDKNKNISFVPLVGNQSISFGKPEDVEQKLRKLEVFYKKILPKSEWKHFTNVDIQFKNQIVCK